MATFQFELQDAEIDRLATVAAQTAVHNLFATGEYGRTPGTAYRVIEERALAAITAMDFSAQIRQIVAAVQSDITAEVVKKVLREEVRRQAKIMAGNGELIPPTQQELGG